jgi:imidazolonepropionase-like amidohydrolase
MRYAPPDLRSDTRSQLPFLKNFTEADYVAAQRTMPVQERFVKSLHDAGARLLLGTDLGGFAVSEELGLLAASGLTPYEVLRAGTHDAAEFIISSTCGERSPSARAGGSSRRGTLGER